MRQMIQTAVDEAIKNGTRRLQITYRRDAINELFDLERLNMAGVIKMKPMSIAIARAVRMSGDWERDSNRTFVVELASDLSDDSKAQFISMMSGNLEKVAYAKPKQTA